MINKDLWFIGLILIMVSSYWLSYITTDIVSIFSIFGLVIGGMFIGRS